MLRSPCGPSLLSLPSDLLFRCRTTTACRGEITIFSLFFPLKNDRFSSEKCLLESISPLRAPRSPSDEGDFSFRLRASRDGETGWSVSRKSEEGFDFADLVAHAPLIPFVRARPARRRALR